MSALSDLQAAVTTNSTLVAQLITADAAKTAGTPDSALAAVTATLVATNQALSAVLTPPAPAPAAAPTPPAA